MEGRKKGRKKRTKEERGLPYISKYKVCPTVTDKNSLTELKLVSQCKVDLKIIFKRHCIHM